MLENNPIRVKANKIRDERFRRDTYRRHHVSRFRKSTILNTLKNYADKSTPHGIAYISEDGRPASERIFWVIVTALALGFTAFQTTTLYMQWKDDPVVTSLDTVALSIEEVDFPAVTICPQGAIREIGDAVLFKQFKEYVMEKKLKKINRMKRFDSQGDLEEMRYEDMMKETMSFLRDVYPRIDGKATTVKPTRMVQAMMAPDPRKAMESETLLGQSEEKDCDENENAKILGTLNKHLKNDTCPEGFDIMEDGNCLHKVTTGKMSYEDAKEYCNALNGARLLQFDTFESFLAIQSFGIHVTGENSTST